MAELTVIILTKNEERNIEKCINSFRGVAKRFVIVDSYSTDNTKIICKNLNEDNNFLVDFYENKWIDYATQFNWAIDNTQINTEWVMRMDADEELTEELAKEIKDKLDSLDRTITGIIIKRRTIFMGKWIRHGGRYPEKLLRIFRRGIARCEQRIMDEHLILNNGDTVSFKNDLIDNNKKNLEWWINKHNWYSNREVLDHEATLSLVNDESLGKNTSTMQAKNKRMMKNGIYYKLPLFFRAKMYFIYRYYFRLGFLDGKEGKIYHFLQAYWYRFLVDAKMYEVKKTGINIQPQGDLK